MTPARRESMAPGTSAIATRTVGEVSHYRFPSLRFPLLLVQFTQRTRPMLNDPSLDAPLTGDSLLDMIAAMPGSTRTEQCRACGYEIDGKLKFTDFFTAILEARGELKTEEQHNEELIQKYPEQKDILTELLEDYDAEPIEEFIEYFGEENLESFTDSYQDEMSGAEFAERLVTDCYCLDNPAFVAIDWEETWENLRYDYTELSGHIFCLNF